MKKKAKEMDIASIKGNKKVNQQEVKATSKTVKFASKKVQGISKK